MQTVLEKFTKRYHESVSKLPPPDKGSPDKTGPDKPPRYSWHLANGWRSGFFPGVLWQLANRSGDATFAHAASRWTASLSSWASRTDTHDVGFVTFSSFGAGLRLTNASARPHGYQAVLHAAAHSLARRYRPSVGMIRSWGHIDDMDEFEVIIDNVMNLELLLWASEQPPANHTLAKIAASHASRSADLFFRADNSTAHLCVLSPQTGALKRPCTGTPQGYAANSTWARGQSWAIYGFTMCHRYMARSAWADVAAHAPRMLNAARRAASFYRQHAPQEDMVPFWDYAFEGSPPGTPGAFRDTSAAAIGASGLLELSATLQRVEGGPDGTANEEEDAQSYLDVAAAALHGLLWEAALEAGAASPAVLAANAHDCGTPNCTIIESEYYVLEALRRVPTRAWGA